MYPLRSASFSPLELLAGNKGEACLRGAPPNWLDLEKAGRLASAAAENRLAELHILVSRQRGNRASRSPRKSVKKRASDLTICKRSAIVNGRRAPRLLTCPRSATAVAPSRIRLLLYRRRKKPA